MPKRTFTPEQMKARAEAAKRSYWRNHERTLALCKKNYYRNREARLQAMRAWRERPGSGYKDAYRRHYVKKRYGVSLEEYEKLTGETKKCQLCGRGPDGKGRTGQRLHIDHCHETGKIRGVLCRECNVGLGMFRDDVKVMQRALKYLLKHKRSK